MPGWGTILAAEWSTGCIHRGGTPLWEFLPFCACRCAWGNPLQRGSPNMHITAMWNMWGGLVKNFIIARRWRLFLPYDSSPLYWERSQEETMNSNLSTTADKYWYRCVFHTLVFERDLKPLLQDKFHSPRFSNGITKRLHKVVEANGIS